MPVHEFCLSVYWDFKIIPFIVLSYLKSAVIVLLIEMKFGVILPVVEGGHCGH